MKILFWINKVRTSRNGEAPVMMRLTHKGVRQNVTLDLKVSPSLWDCKKQRVKGNNETAEAANNLIRAVCLQTKVYFLS